ncbi:MAG: acylphosphatase [Candidatus Omnitrophica bacterium]|nr:acylphosphatase [Candidatus Omnitrophota bacterium]
MRKRFHVYFSGSVQGVGFRFTTVRLARRFPVTGFVRNLASGKVELVAEGEEKTLQEFLKAVREAFRDCVRDVETEWGSATAGFEGFGIKF